MKKVDKFKLLSTELKKTEWEIIQGLMVWVDDEGSNKDSDSSRKYFPTRKMHLAIRTGIKSWPGKYDIQNCAQITVLRPKGKNYGYVLNKIIFTGTLKVEYEHWKNNKVEAYRCWVQDIYEKVIEWLIKKNIIKRDFDLF